jgi:hypothetical protein
MNAAADRFHEQVRSYGQRIGLVNHFPVIERHRDTDAWIEWQRYFRSLGMNWSASEMKYADRWTVPTLRPRDFDTSAP